MTIKPPLELDRTTDPDYNADEAIQRGLQRFTDILQDYIARFPHQWLWAHKRWKTSPSLRVLILADGKAGHLNQACAVSKQIRRIVFEKAAGDQRMELFKRVCNAKNALQDAERLLYSEQVLLVEFKSKAHRLLLHLCSLFASSGCQGCARCLGFCLTKRSYEQLIFTHADVIISCGWSLAGVNRFLSMENNAKKIVIMKPSFLPKRNFNLCIIPRHDIGKGKTLTPRIVITEGAPNLIDGNYIKTNAEALRTFGLQTEDLKPPSPVIGILLGGNTKNFVLNTQIAEELLKGIIDVAGDLDARLLITTSRRTPSFVEDILKAKLVGIERCKLLVIANEKNIPQAIGGILGLSDIVVVSGDSISMVSEAASSGKKVIVFAPESAMQRASSKHARFLKNLSRQGYITLATEDNITDAIKERLNDSAPAKRLNDSDLIYQALKRIV